MNWTDKHREGVRKWLEIVQPHNSAALVENIEDFMPKQWRDGFEALFAELAKSYPVDVAVKPKKKRARRA